MNRKFIILFLSGIAFFSACKKPGTTIILDETTEDMEPYDYYIDSNGNEGILFLGAKSGISSSGIVISLDESVLSWGPLEQRLFAVDSLSEWDTEYNSKYSLAVLQQMFANGISRYPAQEWCNKKNNGSVPYAGSWRLPSKYEWYKICDYVDEINSALIEAGGVKIDKESVYWTSQEDYPMTSNEDSTDYDPFNRAVPMSPTKVVYSNKDRWIKEMKYKVRAIKYILYEN